MATSTWHPAEVHRARRVNSLRGWRRTALVVLGAVALSGLGLFASHSSFFHVRTIDVTGTSHLTRQEVVRLSGLTTRANALWLGTTPIERRLETDPWVAHATVSRSLPWTVRIQITERRPIAVTVQEGGYELIAGDGTSLGDVAANPGLPEIVMPVSWGEYAPSDVSGPAEAIAGLDPRIRSKVQWAVVAPDSTIDLFLGNGLRVRYGEPTQIPAKSRALLRVLRWARMQGESLVAVDVLAPDAPAATLAG